MIIQKIWRGIVDLDSFVSKMNSIHVEISVSFYLNFQVVVDIFQTTLYFWTRTTLSLLPGR